MNEDKAAVALRLIIRAVIGATSADPQSLRNVNTTIFPDGAECFVTATRALYQLDKGSSAAADNVSIIAPGSGPGRWFILAQAPGATSLVEIVGTAVNTADTTGASGNFFGIATSAFAFQPASPVPAGWALTAAGGILTYNGAAPVRARATFTGSVSVVGESGGIVWAAIDLNSDTFGLSGATSFLPGTQTTDAGGDGFPAAIGSQRTLLLAPGDTLGIVLATTANANLSLARGTLSVLLA